MDERSRQLLENADALLQRVAQREIPETLWELPPQQPERTPPSPLPKPEPPAQNADPFVRLSTVIALAEEIGRDTGKLERELKARLERLEERLDGAVERAALALRLEALERQLEGGGRAALPPPRLLKAPDAA